MLLSLVAPPAPSPGRLVTGWSVDVALVGVVALAGLYLAGVRGLEARGRRWPVARTIAFAAGLLLIVIATMSGLAAYDRVLFSMHVVQHVILGMVAPILLVLGRPVTLALQASHRPTQERLVTVFHSRPVRAVANPAVAWVMFAGTLVVLYFTGLYELSLRNGWVHAAVHVHFVAAGALFLAFVVGLDPIPGAMSFGARALFVFVLVPFHAFLGVALLGTDHVLAADWYRGVQRSWGVSSLADQRTGAGILWVASELFGVLAIAVLARQWMRAEERKAARIDRRLDAERLLSSG